MASLVSLEVWYLQTLWQQLHTGSHTYSIHTRFCAAFFPTWKCHELLLRILNQVSFILNELHFLLLTSLCLSTQHELQLYSGPNDKV